MSAARTAKPSTVERANPGKGCVARTAALGTRPAASAKATLSARVRRSGRKPAIAALTVRTEKNSRFIGAGMAQVIGAGIAQAGC